MPAAGGAKLVKLNKIYTRTGDDGSAGLVDGSRAPKDGARMTAIGEVDEANSMIGAARASLAQGDAFDAVLGRIQNELFDLGADLATPSGIEGALRIVDAQVTRLETDIDAVNDDLAPLTSFILPGGAADAAALHLARAVVRRAERAAVHLAAQEPTNPAARAYLNRLSDLLFVMARSAAIRSGGEVLWQPGATRG